MNFDRYKKIVDKNAKILKHCLETRTTDLSEITFWEDVKGKDLPFDQLCAKAYDILGCCAVGAIPSKEKSGADGYFYYGDGTGPFEIESKVSSIESKNIYVGSRGGLYWSSDPTNPTNKASLTTRFMGAFDPYMSSSTMLTKSRHTALVCFDRDKNAIIDGWVLEPSQVRYHLKKRSKNATLSLKLSVFINEGSVIKCHIPTLGWSNWQSTQFTDAKSNKRFI